LHRDFGPYFDVKAQAIMEGNPVQLRTTAGTVTARLIRFRHDSVLEWDTVSTKRGRTGQGSQRIDERSMDARGAIVERLALKVLELSQDARPIL
jgi:hypothetical protein